MNLSKAFIGVISHQVKFTGLVIFVKFDTFTKQGGRLENNETSEITGAQVNY